MDRGGPKSRQQPARGWRASIRELRPDLYSAVNPWDRITAAEALRELLSAGGVSDAKITAEQGTQPLRSGEDWWQVVLGSGYRWTVEQMGPEDADRARRMNPDRVRARGVSAVETNVLFAVTTKPGSGADGGHQAQLSLWSDVAGRGLFGLATDILEHTVTLDICTH